jgi:hypothetical protein
MENHSLRSWHPTLVSNVHSEQELTRRFENLSEMLELLVARVVSYQFGVVSDAGWNIVETVCGYSSCKTTTPLTQD